MHRIQLFLGPEKNQRSQALELELKKLPPSCPLVRIYVSDETTESLLDKLQSPSLFAHQRAFLVFEAEKMKNPEKILKKSFLFTQNWLFLISDETKLTQIEKHIPDAPKKVFWQLSEKDKLNYILTRFRREGHRIDKETADFFLNMAGDESAHLEMLIMQILSQLKENQDLSKELLGEWIVHSRQESAYTLFYSTLEGNLDLTLLRLHSLFDAGNDAIGLLAQIRWQLQRFFQLKQAAGSPLVYKELGIFRAEWGFYQEGLRQYSLQTIQNALRHSAELSLELRRTPKERQKILLELFFYSFIAREGKALAQRSQWPRRVFSSYFEPLGS